MVLVRMGYPDDPQHRGCGHEVASRGANARGRLVACMLLASLRAATRMRWCVAGLGYGGKICLATVMLLNAMLSLDNLVVFMMFLKHAELPLHNHRRVIS